MLLILGLAALLQGDVERRLADLDHEDVQVREAAAKDLLARGPAMAAPLVEAYRKSASVEARSRLEDILLKIPFPAYLLVRADEPLRARLEARLLLPLDAHRPHAGCWRGQGASAKIDPARLRIVWQEASGHGQMLRLTWIGPAEAGGLTFRKLTFQGKTPFRPEVQEEGVSASEAALGAAESAALASLLDQATTLRPEGCAIPSVPGRGSFSSASFSVRLRVDAGDVELWSSGFTGYPGDHVKSMYFHSRAIEQVMEGVVKGLVWKRAEIDRPDRAKISAWILARFETEEWWIREHFLRSAKYAGDESLLPLLRKVADSVPGEFQPSEKRQVVEAREALQVLEAPKK